MNKIKSGFEPFWWSWFSAGGTVAAFLLPVLLLIFGIAIPLGWIQAPSYNAMQGLARPVIIRLPLFLIIVVSLLHWAHRFRFTLYEGLQLHRYNLLLATVCYGSAIIFSFFAGFILWNY